MVQIRVTCLDPSGLAAIGWFAPTPPPPCATSAKKVAQGSITLTHYSATTCIASATAAPLFSRRGASGARLRWHDRHMPSFHNAHDVTRFGPELNQADFFTGNRLSSA